MMSLLDRLVARVRIDWCGFAVTRGGLYQYTADYLSTQYGPAFYTPWPHGRPPPPPAVLEARGGWCAPSAPIYDFTVDLSAVTFEPWRAWYCRRAWSLADDLPVIGARRGAIRYVSDG